jgi:hypothetical protein
MLTKASVRRVCSTLRCSMPHVRRACAMPCLQSEDEACPTAWASCTSTGKPSWRIFGSCATPCKLFWTASMSLYLCCFRMRRQKLHVRQSEEAVVHTRAAGSGPTMACAKLGGAPFPHTGIPRAGLRGPIYLAILASRRESLAHGHSDWYRAGVHLCLRASGRSRQTAQRRFGPAHLLAFRCRPSLLGLTQA